jgi:hypothetical protein
MPLKSGLDPDSSVIKNESVGIVDKGLWGSLMSVRVWSPVFATVTVSNRLVTSVTASGP